MLYVQIFIVVFGKRIKVDPPRFLFTPLGCKEIFQYERTSERVVWHQKGVVACSCVLLCLQYPQHDREVSASRIRVPRAEHLI